MRKGVGRLSGLWLKDGKKGKFMSGKLDDAPIFIFKNDRKQADNDPDYYQFKAVDDDEQPPVDDGIPY